MVKKGGAAAGLATSLLLLMMGVLASPANAGPISETEIDDAHWGWASIYEEDGDDDVATVLLWGFGIALLWPNGHEATAPPPVNPPPGGDKGDDPIVPEVSTLALVGMGAVALLALRKRQK